MKLATLCYIRNDNKILLLHRNKKENDIHAGKYNGLGGKFEQGETPEACARREIFEESGLVAESLDLRGFITFPKFARGEDWYVFIFVIDKVSGELIDSPEGTLEWVEESKLGSLNFWEGDRIFMPWLFEQKRFSACFVYESGKLADYSVHFYA
ncbi:MAG: 8-oxo-dGTP diphosphatase [Clostridiales bacterium]|nr:8-oxo-dGTP diphosphatase [Clostridiales bacterium]MDN5281971.1 8-oxo-dGTP diphosphatase [Candidatus Ozemobacter sp.]